MEGRRFVAAVAVITLADVSVSPPGPAANIAMGFIDNTVHVRRDGGDDAPPSRG